jgi:hypothetical protein
MPRVLVPELLDSLPHDHPDAIASRRDLRRINALMGNFRWLQMQLTRCDDGRGPILEIGAGDGGLMRRICAAAPDLAPRCHALDLAPRPASWPAGATWHQTDLWSDEAADCLGGAEIVLANLVLHHFDNEDLARLGARLMRCRVLLACEPCRREFHVWQGRLLYPLLNRVTRHDMVVSIRGGFRGRELAAGLGPGFAGAECAVVETLRGACRCQITRSLP